MDEEIHRTPARLERVEAGIKAAVVSNINVHKEIGPDRGGERFDPFAEGVTLV